MVADAAPVAVVVVVAAVAVTSAVVVAAVGQSVDVVAGEVLLLDRMLGAAPAVRMQVA